MVSKVKYYNNFNIQKKHKNSIILIGNFDGVHLGHQKLFKKALILKKRKLKLKILLSQLYLKFLDYIIYLLS